MNVFVAISNTGTLNRIMVSNDGYTWYPKNSLIDNNWTSICWADLISKFMQSRKICCFEITEVNPTLDKENLMAEIAFNILQRSVNVLMMN